MKQMVSDPKVESFWRTQYQNFQVSNLSRSIFCRNNNLTLHQSFYWFKKIKLIDEEKSKTSNNFIPVKYEKKDDESIFEFSVIANFPSCDFGTISPFTSTATLFA